MRDIQDEKFDDGGEKPVEGDAKEMNNWPAAYLTLTSGCTSYLVYFLFFLSLSLFLKVY